MNARMQVRLMNNHLILGSYSAMNCLEQSIRAIVTRVRYAVLHCCNNRMLAALSDGEIVP
jgi:hypothetical protein